MSKFKPKPLAPESYEAPLEPRWRVMGADEERRLHAHALAEHRRFRSFGPRTRRRLLRYVLGSAVGYFVACFALVAMRFTTCLVFAAVGALVGAIVAWWRPSQGGAAVLYGLSGVLASLLAGRHPMLAMLAMLGFIVIGAAVGIGEDAQRMDSAD